MPEAFVVKRTSLTSFNVLYVPNYVINLLPLSQNRLQLTEYQSTQFLIQLFELSFYIEGGNLQYVDINPKTLIWDSENEQLTLLKNLDAHGGYQEPRDRICRIILWLYSKNSPDWIDVKNLKLSVKNLKLAFYHVPLSNEFLQFLYLYYKNYHRDSSNFHHSLTVFLTNSKAFEPKSPHETRGGILIKVFVICFFALSFMIGTLVSLILYVSEKTGVFLAFLIFIGYLSYVIILPLIKTIRLLIKNHGTLGEFSDLYYDLSVWAVNLNIKKLYKS